jgi:hypothetical protein
VWKISYSGDIHIPLTEMQAACAIHTHRPPNYVRRFGAAIQVPRPTQPSVRLSPNPLVACLMRQRQLLEPPEPLKPAGGHERHAKSGDCHLAMDGTGNVLLPVLGAAAVFTLARHAARGHEGVEGAHLGDTPSS